MQPPRPSRPEEPEHIMQPHDRLTQLQEPPSIIECFDRIKHMIPDYEWTCFNKGNDLIHVPTRVVLASEMEGYYIQVPAPFFPGGAALDSAQIPFYDLFNEDYTMHTQDPKLAVQEWFAYVMKRLAAQAL